MSKVLVTGAQGMLGRAFCELITAHHPALSLLAPVRGALDISDRGQVLALEQGDLDFIIHCAANVNADACEQDPLQCRRVQVEGTRHVAELARRSGARVLYPQSFLIFGESREPITETTAPAPLSVYGQCKWQAEQDLRAALPSALVVRMGGFFGGEAADKNFVGKFLPHVRRLIEAGTPSYAVGERVWQPTWTQDLAANSLALLLDSREGVYNMASHGEASFFELAQACVALLGLESRLEVTLASSAETARHDTALRPWRAVMANARLQAEGRDLQRPWREALARYLAGSYFQDMFRGLSNNAAATL